MNTQDVQNEYVRTIKTKLRKIINTECGGKQYIFAKKYNLSTSKVTRILSADYQQLLRYQTELISILGTDSVQIVTNNFLNGDIINTEPNKMGWICPICKNGISPYYSYCPCCSSV